MKKSYILLLVLALLIFLISCQGKNDESPEHMHLYNQEVKSATCQEGGYTTKVCTTCGDTITTDYTARVECSGEAWTTTKEATCTQTGERQQSCKTCGKLLSVEAIPMTEHQPVTSVSKLPTCLEEGIRTTTCGICSKVLGAENISALETHDFEITTIPSTSSSQGKTIYTCKICKHSEQGEFLDKITGVEATEIYEKASKATVRVEAYDKGGKLCSIGTGFLYTANGRVITNYHVIATAYTAKVIFYDGTSYSVASVLGNSPAQDVAILQINKTNADYLEISTEKVKTGDTVYALGNPLGVNNIFTSGIVSNESMTISGKECIAFTAPISPGNSGGPLMNSRGEVVGINSMYIPDAQNLNFAILIDKATSLDQSSPVTTQALYTSMLKQNAYDILMAYIAKNYDYTEDETYVIKSVLPEEGENVGLEYRYTYDSEASLVVIDVLVIKGAQYKYDLSIYMYQGTTIYDVTMYDFEANQTTIEATIDASKALTGYSESFWLFSILEFRYDPAEADKTETRKEFFYTLYTLATDDFKAMLQKSYTGLTILEFFPNWTYNQ